MIRNAVFNLRQRCDSTLRRTSITKHFLQNQHYHHYHRRPTASSLAPSSFFSSPRLTNVSTSAFATLPSFQSRSLAIRRKRPVRQGHNNDAVITNADIRRFVGGLDTEIRLVFPDGSNKIMPLRDALIRGKDEKLDIILASKQSKPATCKILDLGLHKYNLRKKEAEMRKKAPLPLKTIKFKVKIEKGDFLRKAEKARIFLSLGHTVRLSIVLVKRFPQGEERADFLFREFSGAVADLVMDSSLKTGLLKEASQRISDFVPKKTMAVEDSEEKEKKESV
jgi:translation initiation factor IF-3